MSGRTGGVVTVLVVLVVAGAVGALVLTGALGGQAVRAEELDRVLVVAASPDEHGEVVGQIVAVVSVADGGVEALDPGMQVAIPGTSYSTLADAYPFGGGAGTAAAYARASGSERLPYVALGPEQLSAAVAGAGGLEIMLPTDVQVFDGERLYSFEEGRRTLDAAEVRALLKGVPYLGDRDREELQATLAGALGRALADSDVLAMPTLDTSLSDEALGRLKGAVGRSGAAR